MLRIGVKLPPGIAQLGEFVADVAAIEAAGADSIWLDVDAERTAETLIQLGVILAITHRVRVGLIAQASTISSSELDGALKTVHAISGGRALGAVRPRRKGGSRLLVATGDWPGSEADAERWGESEIGEDRAAWRQTLEAQTRAGLAGVVVAWAPRIVDLLRNPDLDDDRSDLLISTG